MLQAGSGAQHVGKALRFARAARVLLADGLHDAAAADSYDAVFHGAQALLASAGHAAETHAAVHALLARHFVRLGPLPRDFSQRFSHLMADRLLADYGVDEQINAESGAKALASAAGMLAELAAALAVHVPEAGGDIARLAEEARRLADAAAPPAAIA